MLNRKTDDVVLLGELAQACEVSRGTVYIWARSGVIPVEFRGGRYEMKRSDLRRVVRQHRRRRVAV